MAGVLWPKIAEFVCVKCNILHKFPVLFVYNSLPLQTMWEYRKNTNK